MDYPDINTRKRLVYLGRGIVTDKESNLLGESAMLYNDPIDCQSLYAQFDSMVLMPYCFGLHKFKKDSFIIEESNHVQR